MATAKEIYYIEETEITGIEFLTEEEKEGLKKARKRENERTIKRRVLQKCRNMESNLFHFFQKNILRGWLRYQIPRLLFL